MTLQLPGSMSNVGASAPARVLLVDDDEHVLGMLARTLEAVGLEVTTASNGALALKRLAASAYDVIVSDIAMPGLDGIRLLRLVRHRDSDVPVILMTGSPTLESAIQAINHGALCYLTKPVFRTELRDAVWRGVQLHELARAKKAALRLVNGDASTSTLRPVRSGA